MYGVSKINIEPSLMMISVQDVEFKGNSLARYLQIFADNGEDMVTSCGVAARALNALAMAGIEVLLITTSDLDISLLVHAENEDAAYETLKKAYEL